MDGRNVPVAGKVKSRMLARVAVLLALVATTVAVQGTTIPSAYAEKGGAKLRLKQPNGGEIWVRGETVKIRWRSVGFTGFNVHIELLKNGAIERVIADVTANDGKLRWVVPQDLNPGTDYKVRIISVADPTLKDRSNDYFSVVGL